MSARHKGEIYIGLIIAMAILAILSQAIMSLVLASYDLLFFTSARTNAKHIAAEQMELVRNLPFDDVATIGGIPAGNLPQIQNVQRNGLNFTVRTSITYVDDPFDGTAGSDPLDLLPTDYKKVRVEVGWGGIAPSRNNPVIILSDIAPHGVETVVGGGTLSILVFDANSKPVSQADVHIVASSVSPPVDITQKTGSNGRLIFPGAPACDSCYQITVSKSGYTTDRTYSTAEVANPDNPHATVLDQLLVEVGFSIDLPSTLTISSFGDRDSGFAALPNQTFHLRGMNQTIGTDVDDELVYKYDEDLTTDANGSLTLANMEWDSYEFTSTSSGYDIAGLNPLAPILVNPNTTINFKYALSANTSNTLRAVFTDQAGTLIASVSARLSEGVFEASASSGLSSDPDFGQIFFKTLNAATYLLEATVSGFQNFSGNVGVSGDSIENVTLTP